MVNVNGQISGEEEAVISVLDHGFLYGEGIYETMRTYNDRLFMYDRHVRRLRNSAGMINLVIPFTDEELGWHITDTIHATNLGGEQAYLRVLVTRGIGDLSYDLKATPKPSWVIIVKPLVEPAPEIYERGCKVALVDVVRNHPRAVNPMIKSNNLMNQALAAQQALARGAFDGVMRNYRGELTECATSNLFLVRHGTVLTPPITSGVLPGVTRDLLFELGRNAGIEVREQVLGDDDLFQADESFLTSTTREVVPIVAVDERAIGTGEPGPVTGKLMKAYRHFARSRAP
jgi:branched-chain amino acid aminotransferase